MGRHAEDWMIAWISLNLPRGRRLAPALLLGLCLLVALPARALSPAAEADRQMLAAKTAMDAADWSTAVHAFDAVEATGVKKLPESFDYLFGKSLNAAGDPARATKYLERYVDRFDTRGKFYKEALAELNAAEKSRAQLAADKVRRDEAARQEALRVAAEAQRQALIDASWVRMETRYWRMAKKPGESLEDTHTCSRTRSRIEREVEQIRNFSCSCRTDYVQHPAWRDHLETVCTATWEGNTVFNDKKGALYIRDSVSNSYSIETQKVD
jgi:hypothetical protein